MTIKQVAFKRGHHTFGGIMLEDGSIVCGCCGGRYEANDPETKIIRVFEYWVDLSEEIIGGIDLTEEEDE